MKTLTRVAALSTAAFLCAAAAQAATVQLKNLSAEWSGADNATASYLNNPSLAPTVNWGTGGTSGYDLEILGDPLPNPAIGPDLDFDLAKFTHRNQPINSGTAITSVDLSITADIVLDTGTLEVIQNAVFKFSFKHNETPNNQNPGSGAQCTVPDFDTEPCGDLVTVSLLNDTSTFNAGGQEYTLTVKGFEQGGVIKEEFFSDEGGPPAMATIVARFSAPDSAPPIPVPASLPLTLAGFGLLGILAHRRRRKSA